MILTKSIPFLWSESVASAHEDLKIMCEDGGLLTSQVLMAAASPWLRSLLDIRHAQEESAVQVLLMPDIKIDTMLTVVELLMEGCATSMPGAVDQLIQVTKFLDIGMRNFDNTNQDEQETDPSMEHLISQDVLSSDFAGRRDDEALNRVDNQCSSSDRVNMTSAELVVARQKLGNSKLHLDGKNVVCGFCQKLVQIPGERKKRGKVMYFQRRHHPQCREKHGANSDYEVLTAPDHKVKFFGEGDKDCLEEVWKKHQEEREHATKTGGEVSHHGRRKSELPSLASIRTFLDALGGAVLVDDGTKVKCGLCRNKFRVTAGRPIMGNLRYFEKTHLLRCKGRVCEDTAEELISDRFCERKFDFKVKKSATPKWDQKRGDLVCLLIANRKDLCIPDECDFKPSSNYICKRKQSLFGANVCFVCIKHYDDIADHFKQIHPEVSEPFYCLACQSSYSSHEILLQHLDSGHNFKLSYSCEHCCSKFETQSKLNRHISEAHPKEKLSYYCYDCAQIFPTFPALKQHQKTHTDSNYPSTILSIAKAFKCRFCNIEIMYGLHLENHIKTDHVENLSLGEKPFYCHICPKEDHHSFNEFYFFELHLLKNHGVSMGNVCRYCLRSFNNRNEFVVHFTEAHPDQNPFECPRWGCGKTMSKQAKIKDHLIMHRLKEGNISEDMKILCNECGKVFYLKKKHDEHIRVVHKKKNDCKEKKYQCHHCIKAFFSNSQLQEHIRKHEGNPGYMCDLCGKGFYRKDRLAIHSKTVHYGEKNFGCSMCDKKFVDNYKLKRHLKTHETVRNNSVKNEEQQSLLRRKISLNVEDAPQLY